jgi:hypothetical protein
MIGSPENITVVTPASFSRATAAAASSARGVAGAVDVGDVDDELDPTLLEQLTHEGVAASS